MSVTEIAPRGGDFERTPPHDIDAERCVLGGMLLSKDAISDVLEVIRPHDHYRPAHQIVHEVILDLYGRGEPADAVTVAAELTRRGEVGRVGGADYLHTLIASVPTAANAGYYARIVRERAILRRLVEVGTRIVQLGYSGDGEADDLVDQAQAEVYSVTDRRVSEDYLPLSEIMPGALDEIEAIGSHGGRMTGVPTGFADLDSLTNGLHPGQMVVIAARPALGKALALDTPLPTPTGWTTMGEVRVGDHLIGADGKPTRVAAATEIMHERPCFEVEFDDGTVIIADAGHQWRTTNGAVRQGIKTTAQIAATLRSPVDGRHSHAVTVAQAAELPAKELPFPPYALGAWLGAGTGRSGQLVGVDPEIIVEIEAEGLRVVKSPGLRSRSDIRLTGPARVDHGSTTAILRKLGVLGDKHIPPEYLRAAESQRRALLAGLLDTDGYVARNGTVQFAVTNRRLTVGTLELVLSLGYRARMTTKQVRGATEESSTCYMVTFTPADKVFRLTRKLARQSTRSHPTTRCRFITDVRPVPTVPVRCVQVDNADHTYLAGRSWIPTHNSTLALDLARAASVQHGLATVIFSLEMSRNEITMRLLSAEARVPLHTMRTGQLSDDDWTRLARRMSEVVDAPLFIDDSPNLTLMEIRAKCRRLKQRNDLRMVIIDYLQLMSSPRRVENRQQEVSEMSRSLKLLAKELDVPVVAVSQLNRGPEQRTDKRPMLSDLRESGCLTADAALLRADTGAPVTFAELMQSGHRDILVWSVDQHQRLVPSPITDVFASGVKNVYRVRLASGREVKASGNHPFLTFDGWTPLEDLTVGDRVGVARRIPEPIGADLGWSEHRLGLLAHLIGDGCVLRKQPVHYTSADQANVAFVEAAAAAEFGITARRVPQETWFHAYLPAPYRCARGRFNPLHTWFLELGISDLRSYQKRIPTALYSASNREIAIFLRHLWATDGNVTVPRRKTAPKVYYASSSRELADGVALLLARFGIIARIRQVTKSGYRPGFHVIVADGPSLRTFCREIGVHGARGELVDELLSFLDGRSVNTNVDTLPPEVWDLVKAERTRAGLSERQFQAAISTHYCGSTLYKSCPSRERLMRCANALDSAVLRQVASSDIYWDRIVAVEALGPHPVYDATVKDTHNFIANGINLHNSIEQDSDMVILLHREDAYERESPRAGEADLVVAKHRNGPTATVTVAFQGHYSRFVDMAPG
ncbi:MAG TPA: replicative DNA helicase [Streptosporangiaceae bacterium]